MKKINEQKLKNKLFEMSCDISTMYHSCYKQEQGYQFWIYLDLETLELKESAMLTMSTIPNPANWYPETNTILIDCIESNGLEGLSNRDYKYYEQNPQDYLDEEFENLVNKIIKQLRKYDLLK